MPIDEMSGRNTKKKNKMRDERVVLIVGDSNEWYPFLKMASNAIRTFHAKNDLWPWMADSFRRCNWDEHFNFEKIYQTIRYRAKRNDMKTVVTIAGE